MNAVHADLSQLRINWQEGQPFTTWKPNFSPADAESYRFYLNQSQSVGVLIDFYRNQHAGSSLISSANRMLPEKDPIWTKLGSAPHTETIQGLQFAVREETLQSATDSLLVWHWYWIDGHTTENDYVGKLRQVQEKLLMRGDDGAAIVIFAAYSDRPDGARDVLRSFLTGNLSSIEATLTQTRNQSGVNP
jgi:EpsI family protein